jgi:hypothetical protein
MKDEVVMVDAGSRLSPALDQLRAHRVSSAAEAIDAFHRSRPKALWIAPTPSASKLLASAVPGQRVRGDRRLLVLRKTARERLKLLQTVFRHVVGVEDGIRLLPLRELVEVLGSPDRQDLIIGGTASDKDGALILYRGDLEPLVVPLSWFPVRPGGPRPRLRELEVTDHGQTVRLGEYEAATDAILYDFDEQYRRRAKKRRLHEDQSLGAALRRLRLQRGLGRSDFPGLSAKEIARIERGEVKSPHAATLSTVAKRLGVAPEEIASY